MTEAIIDAWMQHPNVAFLQHEMFAPLWRWTRRAAPHRSDPPERTLTAMDEAGVRVGMLCAWWGPNGPLITNDQVADLVRRWPHRFAGVASVDLARPVAGVRELRRCVHDLGFKALGIVPWLWDLPPDDRRYGL